MIKQDLMKFCNPDHLKLKEPFSRGLYSYATDGHVLVRISRLADVPENDNAPNPESLFPSKIPVDRCLPIPDFDLPEDEPCKSCDGNGRNFECEECRGACEVELSNSYSDYVVDCLSCGATGKMDFCEDCEGTGRQTPMKKIPIGTALFQAKYLSLLRELPNCKIFDTGDLSPALFCFDGGDGLLMPVKGISA